jgi:glucosamine-6-phosphate deaminase
LPHYLSIAHDALGRGTSIEVRIVPDNTALAQQMAGDMLRVIADARSAGRSPTLIIPVGPVDQFPVLAEEVNRQQISLEDVCLINMDEYLTDDDAWIPREHPLSFRAFMDRCFYDLIDPQLAPLNDLRVFPDPSRPDDIARLIESRGGFDACFGGIGINGHIAFNEPPEPGAQMTVQAFADLPTRVLSLSRETRTINANTTGGSIDVVPRRCITVGMREILAAKQLRLYCNRPWHSAVVRKVLHGPIGPECPASMMRTHPNASITMTEQVAELPRIALR